MNGLFVSLDPSDRFVILDPGDLISSSKHRWPISNRSY